VNRAQTVDAILRQAPVLPVLQIADLELAIPLAETLVAAGLPVLEVTLRTEVALAAISAIRRAVPGAIVGAGTILRPEQLQEVAAAGAHFAISPGASSGLYQAETSIPWIPAVASASEIMQGMAFGHQRYKFFPATAAGGTAALKAFAGPFPNVKFCPTGGIDASSAAGFLSLSNVLTVGGSWMVPNALLAKRDWSAIAELAKAAVTMATSAKTSARD